MKHSLLKHEKTFDIAWGDMDALGHVNNARYFDYFQEARIEWMRPLKLDMTKGEGPVIIHTACTFYKPIIYPSTVTIKSELNNLGTTSMVMNHSIFKNDVLMADGLSKIVWIEYKTKKPIPIPQSIRDLFEK